MNDPGLGEAINRFTQPRGRTAVTIEVASSSSPGTKYRVWVGPQGPIFCDCPGHKYARGGVRKPCKHMKAVGGTNVRQMAAEVLRMGQSAEQATTSLIELQQAARRASADGAADTIANRVKFLEIQEENEAGEWTVVADVSRFNNLEL